MQHIAEIVERKAGESAGAEEGGVDGLPAGADETKGFEVRPEVVDAGLGRHLNSNVAQNGDESNGLCIPGE